MIRACIWLLAGVLALQLSSFPPESGLFVVLVVALAAAFPWLRRRDLLWLLLGGFYFHLHTSLVVDSRLHTDLADDSMLISVRVIDFPRENGSTTSFIAAPIDDERIPRRVRLSWYEPPVAVRLGDVWRLQVRLRRPRGNSNPGSADLESWFFRERIGATGYVGDGRHNQLLDSGTAKGLDRIREHYLERVRRQLDGKESASVIAAIVIGARHLITPEQWDRYARTGTSHLMAISGLHIGLAAVGAYLTFSTVLGLCGFRGNQHDVALVIATLLAFVYAQLSGFAVPAQRAVLMMAYAAPSLLLRRQLGAGRILAASALIMVLADPLSTLAPGFKLSFAAVALLVWFARRQRPALSRRLLKPVNAVLGLVTVQVGLLAGLLPLTILIFDRLSLAAPIVNLLAVPLFSMVTVPFALLSLLLDGPFASAGDLAMQAAASSIDWLEKLILRFDRFERSSFVIAEIERQAWLYLLMPLIWIVLPARWPCRWVALFGLVALPMWRPAAPADRCVEIHALDVGQGLSVVIQTKSKVLVYDSGPAYRSGSNAAEHSLIPFLRSRGIRSVDRLIVSHADLDHAGGVGFLLAEMPVEDVIVGESLPWIGVPLRRCHAGMRWQWNNVQFSILHPKRFDENSGNDASCVLLIEAGGHKALLTGDIESRVEASLVRSRVLPDVDIVSVPHHGSRTSSIGPFVQSLTPAYAVVSAAAGNQWGFPKPDVVARWQSGGAIVLNTASSGAIHVTMCAATGLSAVTEHRKRRRRIWHDVDS